MATNTYREHAGRVEKIILDAVAGYVDEYPLILAAVERELTWDFGPARAKKIAAARIDDAIEALVRRGDLVLNTDYYETNGYIYELGGSK